MADEKKTGLARWRSRAARRLSGWIPVTGDVVIRGIFAALAKKLGDDPVMAAYLAIYAGVVGAAYKETFAPKLQELVEQVGGVDEFRRKAERNPRAALELLRKLIDADPAVVPALARLVDMYAAEPPKPVDRFLRSVVPMLSSMTAEEYTAFGRMFTTARRLSKDHPRLRWRWGSVIRGPYQNKIVSQFLYARDPTDSRAGHEEAPVDFLPEAEALERLIRANRFVDAVSAGSHTLGPVNNSPFTVASDTRTHTANFVDTIDFDRDFIDRVCRVLGIE